VDPFYAVSLERIKNHPVLGIPAVLITSECWHLAIENYDENLSPL